MYDPNDKSQFTPLIPQNNNHAHSSSSTDNNTFVSNAIHGAATRVVQPLHVIYTDPHIHINDAKLYEDNNHQQQQQQQQLHHHHHQPNLHDIAHMKSEDIRQKIEYSQIDGKQIVQRDELAVISSTITANLKSQNIDFNIKQGNQFDDAIHSVPKLDPTAPPSSFTDGKINGQHPSSTMPEFEFKETPYKCEEYKSIYEDPKSMYNTTYGSSTDGNYTIKEYKSVYDQK